MTEYGFTDEEISRMYKQSVAEGQYIVFCDKVCIHTDISLFRMMNDYDFPAGLLREYFTSAVQVITNPTLDKDNQVELLYNLWMSMPQTREYFGLGSGGFLK